MKTTIPSALFPYKWRAYNEANQTMHYFNIANHGKGVHLFPGYWYCTDCGTYCDPTDLSTPMFLTTLFDRDGQEIYESDMLNTYWPDGSLRESTIVCWDNSKAGWNLSPARIEAREHIVVGNIHIGNIFNPIQEEVCNAAIKAGNHNQHGQEMERRY